MKQLFSLSSAHELPPSHAAVHSAVEPERWINTLRFDERWIKQVSVGVMDETWVWFTVKTENECVCFSEAQSFSLCVLRLTALPTGFNTQQRDFREDFKVKACSVVYNDKTICVFTPCFYSERVSWSVIQSLMWLTVIQLVSFVSHQLSSHQSISFKAQRWCTCCLNHQTVTVLLVLVPKNLNHWSADKLSQSKRMAVTSEWLTEWLEGTEDTSLAERAPFG